MPRKGQLPPLTKRRLGFKLPDLRDVPVKWIEEGEGWVVISKPSGLLSVPGKDPAHQDSAQLRVKRRYPSATGGMVAHRLDLPTSGLMVFALNKIALAELNRQFAQREVEKAYTAILTHVPHVGPDIKLALRLDPFQRPLQIHDPIHGKPCHTRWRLLDDSHPLGAKVELIPITGRTHQLRVHAAHPLGLNAPIIGDPHYSVEARADGGAPHGRRLHLHASKLSFADPNTGVMRHFINEPDF